MSCRGSMQEVHTNGGVRSASGTYRARPEVSHTLATKIGAKRDTQSETAEVGEPADAERWANRQKKGGSLVACSAQGQQRGRENASITL